MQTAFEIRRKREWLVAARKAHNLTAKQVAEANGISRSHYSMIENNRAMPSFEVALRIASYLGVDPSLFIHEEMTHFADNVEKKA